MGDYKYNDYTLPALPTWDKTKYPYAMIFLVRSASLMYHLVCHSNPVTVRNVNGENLLGYAVGTKVYDFTYSFIEGNTSWVSKGDVTPTAGSGVTWHYYDADIEWVWCNHDICDESGSVVHAATDPVPIKQFDLKAWLTGYALGLCGKPLPMSQKEPVAYLYNGVRLPKLPEWDREAYPYAVIGTRESNGATYFVAFSYKSAAMRADGAQMVRVSSEFYPCVLSENSWVKASGGFAILSFWSNYDVYYHADLEEVGGTLCLAASEPVPVYA